jgi:hypothetical protein
MALEFAGTLFAAEDKTGPSLMLGLGHAHRYSPVTAAELMGSGLYKKIHSLEILTTSEAAGNVVLFGSDDFSGWFTQFTAAWNEEDWWNLPGDDRHARSAILVAGKRTGKLEMRLSFREQFLADWESLVDKRLKDTLASRHGKPTLTWEMFPASISPLHPNSIYLKIHQRLDIAVPSWPDYAAAMAYHIHLFVNAQHQVRAHGARWAYWVESGVKSGHIGDILKPQVKDGLPILIQEINNRLSKIDAKAPINGVYYLPGRQLDQPATGVLTGHTNDDVTIVLEI